jgi:hypothetical protein
MKVYIVKEWSEEEGFSGVSGVYARYENAIEHAEEIAEYGGFVRQGDLWLMDDMIMVAVDMHGVQ